VLDEEQKKRVAVIGLSVAEKLNLGNDPIGKVIQVDGNGFTVVGIMEKKGGSFGQDRDDMVYMPFSTATSIYGSENMKRLILAFQMKNGSDLDLVKEQVTDVLRARHHLKKGARDDFRILAQEEILKMISKALNTTTMVMGAIVGIALLVGGIGIMNIMLVSVTERTREIGIRKSIGARRQDVLVQFLVEAIALSGLGGAIGVLGGYLLATAARFALQRLVELPPVHTPIWAILLAFGFCAILGVIFGIYPAAKASKLDPIEALRYE
jgi:putative ABC transport system permease protein